MEPTRRIQIVRLVGGLIFAAATVALLSTWLHHPGEPPSPTPVATSEPTLRASEPQTAARSLPTASSQAEAPVAELPQQVSEPQTAAHAPSDPSGEDGSLILAQIDERARAIMLAAARAQGGLRRLLAVRDWTMKAVANLYGAGQSVQVPVTTYIKKPDKLRIEQQLAGQRITAATDGRVAWMQIGGQLLHLPQDKMDELKRQMSNDSGQAFAALSDSTYRFKYLETKELEGRRANIIELSADGRPTVRLYFDDQTHELIQEETQMAQGPITVRLSDFRQISGVTTAFRVETYLNGERLLLLVIEEMAFDTGLKDGLFAAPTR